MSLGARNYVLYVNLASEGSSDFFLIWKDDTTSTRSNAVRWVQADHHQVELYLVDFVTDPDVTVALVAGDVLKISAKDKSDLAAGDVLFSNASWTEFTEGGKTGYRGDVNLNTTELNQWFTDNPTKDSVECQMDVEIRDASNTRRRTLICFVTIARQALVDSGDPSPSEDPYPAPGQLVTKARGTIAISSGASDVTVTGLALADVPAQILLTMRRPAGQPIILASLVDGTITADGFTADLSAATPATGYKLDYLVVLP